MPDRPDGSQRQAFTAAAGYSRSPGRPPEMGSDEARRQGVSYFATQIGGDLLSDWRVKELDDLGLGMGTLSKSEVAT